MVITHDFLQVKPDDPRDHIELCPDAGIIVQDMAGRLQQHGGFALIADYGHSGEKGHTFRVHKTCQYSDLMWIK